MTVFSGGPPTPDGLTSRDFPVLWPVLTRWADNDMFGHLNNAVYYQLFDTAINGWINTNVELDPVAAPSQGIVAESGCRYFFELHFPEQLVVGLAITRLGRTSVTYRLGVFRAGCEGAPARGGEAGGGEAGVSAGCGGGSSSLHSPDPSHLSETIAALGHWVHVYVDRTSRKPAPIPDAIRSLLSTACVGQPGDDAGREAT